jgi:predicted kinase
MNKTKFVMLIGLPGSGKSYLAQDYYCMGYNIHSSDAIREELTGDANRQDINSEVFNLLHKRVKEDLISGQNCVYDATNISWKRRKAFLDELKHISCHKKAIVIATPFEVCVQRNENRERSVPYEVIERMYKNFDIPYYYEGWDEIELYYGEERFKSIYGNLKKYMCEIENYDQESKWHTETLGQHCLNAAHYIEHKYWEDNINHSVTPIYIAAMLHDCGKPFVKTFTDSNGNESDTAHYYSHENVGCYNALFYNVSVSDKDKLYISTLIRWHMQMHFIDKQPHTESKYKKLFGDTLWGDLQWIHKADKSAH